MNTEYDLDAAIRKVPDFPKPGVLFYDITSVLMQPRAFDYCITRMLDAYAETPIDAVVAVESRGFLFATPFARERGLPVVLARKKGKLPGATYSREYELEYGTDTVEMHQADLAPGMRCLIVDDLVATGGTLRAVATIIQEVGASVSGIFCVIGLPFLDYASLLGGLPTTTLIDYHGE